MLSRTPVTRPVSYRVPAWTAAAIGEFKMTVHLLCSSRSTSTTASRARGLCFRLGCASKLIDPSRANQFQPGDAQVEETTAACCPDSICPDNQIPEACSFNCGRVFTTFLRDCRATLEITSHGRIAECGLTPRTRLPRTRLPALHIHYL